MTDAREWLQNRSFHFSQFRDLGRLAERKRELGLTVSLCFPALNEEKTIGKSVVIMKSELMDRYPLLDEIVVIDSGSTDGTCATAAEFGARTYVASEHLREEGSFQGKGENLWKALYLLKGDIIVFIDADISNIHHRFAYGLLGPLLLHPEIRFVKAFYERPMLEDGELRPTGGGRVTEILIRPLFSQFFPDLAGIIQPLSGEYAGHRAIFEKIPFPVGYGVETGMLIDIFQTWGLDVMAQCDLAQRVHRNQELPSLGKMSFGIMQAFWRRLQKYCELGPTEPKSLDLRSIISHDGTHEVRETTIQEVERPPIIDLPVYRARHHPDRPAAEA